MNVILTISTQKVHDGGPFGGSDGRTEPGRDAALRRHFGADPSGRPRALNLASDTCSYIHLKINRANRTRTTVSRTERFSVYSTVVMSLGKLLEFFRVHRRLLIFLFDR